MGGKMSDTSYDRLKHLNSEIINNKAQLILKVDQSNDYIYPNKVYEYDIYCKNMSNHLIEDVHIQVINPENVLIDEDDNNEGIEIGDIPMHQSHLIRLKARCSQTGIYTVHFICYGKGTGLFTQKLTIYCSYNSQNPETTHRIHVYNFTPYEEKYLLQAEDYNDNFTRLRKQQKLPYMAKQNPFSFIKSDPNKGFLIDESQNYLDQKDTLYGDPYNSDEHNYQYIDRENFNKGSIEVFEGQNLVDVINQINDKSKLFRATFLKTGSNRLLNDFKQYNPDGFLYRFGLMSSELFHYLGVLPDYSYMNDLLFTWAPDGSEPLNLYPKKVAMNWNTKKWAGRGFDVYKMYTDEYKNEIINNPEFIPMFQFIGSFDLKETAQEYINKEYETDTTNIYYMQTEDGIVGIRKYQYIIKESYLDTGVFYVHIPLDKIPTNFYLPSTEEIEAIVQRTKPFGMKPLIRYVSTIRFNHNMSFHAYPSIQPLVNFHMGHYDRIRYTIQSMKYKNIIEKICTGNNQYVTREALKLIPCGPTISNAFHVDHSQNINMHLDKPKAQHTLDMDMQISNEAISCSIDNDLSRLSSINELLYQNNFEKISFMISNVQTQPMLDLSTNLPQINTINYKLWIQALEDEEHSKIWDLAIKGKGDNRSYKINIKNNTETTFDFMKISLINQQIRQPNIETGIGFKDITGKLYGISAEYDEHLKLFNIKYTTSNNNNFKIHKKIVSDLTGLAYKIILTRTSTIVLFFIEKDIDGQSTYQYFHHIIVPIIRSAFCFIRNEKDISSIVNLANLISVGSNTNNPILFNTPQYLDFNEYDPKIIITDNINPWTNISRIDRNEYSYAIKHNISNDIEQVDSIQLHFDDIHIPDDAIVKNMSVHAIVESNVDKSIYYSIRNQDGFITPESSINQISLYPIDLEMYPRLNRNKAYYEEQYNIAVANNVQESITYFNNKLQENYFFDEKLGLSLNFLDNINDKITINNPFWCEIASFSNENISFNDIEECVFVIEGYNAGGEVTLSSQLGQNQTMTPSIKTTIPSGYFVKHIPLNFYNQFVLSDVFVKFRFEGLNSNMDIFDVHMDVTFKDKQKSNEIGFSEFESFDIKGKKIIDLDVIKSDTIGYLLKNGFTVKLDFDDLEPGEYYRIYSLVLNITYQAQSIDFLANKENARNVSYNDNFIIVSGDKKAPYLSGMFFNDMPSVYQYKSTSNKDNPGIKLSDTLYQSFVAMDDNITSITLYPNGFVGNPNANIKIGLYQNDGYTPNKLIKEINVNGWSKANASLKNKSVITYNFNVNNLKIGETYWLKFEVEKTNDDSYYLLKYIDEPQLDLKLLTKIDNNLINMFGALKFQVNSIHLYKSFNNISTMQNDFNNPNIYIGLNKGQGYIKNLKVKTK